MTASSNIDGAAVTIQTCTGAIAQKWTFSNGAVKIFDNKCLDVMSGDGVHLQIWTCTGGVNQQFYYTGDYRFVVMSSLDKRHG
jgi:Ricin-type beta-trefoil lectin domain